MVAEIFEDFDPTSKKLLDPSLRLTPLSAPPQNIRKYLKSRRFGVTLQVLSLQPCQKKELYSRYLLIGLSKF